MKRSGPIRRKTELSRGGLKPGKPLQRKPIRKRSKKKDREISDTKDARRLYLEAHPRCCVCGGAATEVHEIPRGPSRMTAVRDPDAWLSACRACHQTELDDYSRWPVARQIAAKWITALESINQHREGRPQTSPEEVIEHLRELIRTR